MSRNSERNSRRLPAGMAVRFRRVTPRARGRFYGGTVQDLSANGAYFRAEKIFPAREKIEARIRIDGDEVEVGAEVTRVDTDGFGVAFTAISETTREALVFLTEDALWRSAIRENAGYKSRKGKK